MNLFDIQAPIDPHLEKAKGIIAFGNQAVVEIKRLYEMSREMMWGIPGYTIADAQAVLDRAESLKPGTSIAMFETHSKFGQFLVTLGVIEENDVKAPVAWAPIPIPNTDPQLYRVQLTGDKYPTESTPENSDTNELGITEEPSELIQ